MSKRRNLETQIRSLNEIKEIMTAMKNLSLMEIHRLARFLDTQRRVVDSIESAAEDFLLFYPHLFPAGEQFRDITLLVGCERGFCGDFHERLLKALDNRIDNIPDATTFIVGGKLAAKLTADHRVVSFLDGPIVVEDVEPVLEKLMEKLINTLVAGNPTVPIRLTVFHHHAGTEDVKVTVLQPLQQSEPRSKKFAFAPELNLAPQEFLAGLAEQYLFALLRGLLYDSLMAENQQRMQHMDLAIRRLERRSGELLIRGNALRQEEITEEIEVIMLSVEALR
jgi:F-type H+-transporting ATPase subunit gamma